MDWEPEDRDLAMAYSAYRASVCQRCGTRPEEWMDSKGYPIEPPPYQAESVRCMGCKALEDARGMVESSKDPSLTFRLRKVKRKIAEEVNSRWQMKRSKSD